MKILLSAVFVAMLSIAGVFITSCGSQPPEITVQADKNEVELEVGGEIKISFTVENYKGDGEVIVRAFDGGIFTENSESQKITFYCEYEGNGRTDVFVTGIGGGRCTILATTKEGNKTAQTVVNVKEYSNKLEQKNDILYVSASSPFVPSSDDFKFSDMATEKDLTFYYVTEPDDILNGSRLSYEGIDDDGNYNFIQEGATERLITKEFVSCILDKANAKLIFTQSSLDLEGNNNTFEVPIKDTEKSYFIAEHENRTTGEFYYSIAYFSCFYGLDTESFKILRGGQPLNDVQLITYTTNEEDSKTEITVQVPYVLKELSEEEQLVFSYDISSTDLTKISVNQANPEIDFVNHTATYTFTILSKIAYKTTAQISFNVSYRDYKKAGDETVSMTKILPIEILVAPQKISVNGYDENDEENNYTFYNSNIGNYGWQEFDIAVYAEDSSYTNCELDFDISKVQVKQGDVNLAEGALITDLKTPLMIRGSNGGAVGSGEISIKLNSKVFAEGQTLTYKIKYNLKAGASRLEFENDLHKYSATNQNNGIYVSSSQADVEYVGIYADCDFTSATVASIGDEKIIDVLYTGKTVVSNKYYLKLALRPIKEGIETFVITLDNGQSVNATFRVVDTFDNLYINQKQGAENNGVQHIEKLAVDTDGNDTGINIILRNSFSDEETPVEYGKVATLQINTNNGVGVISSISYDYTSETDDSVIYVEEREKGEFAFKTISYGHAELTFEVEGIKVEDFTPATSTKNLKVFISSYNPISNLLVYKEGSTELANSITLYTSEGGSNINSSIDLTPQVLGQPYNFCDYTASSNGEYVESLFQQKFIYYTCSEKIIDAVNGSVVDKMIYGKTYYIGNDRFATFDTTTMTIKALPSRNEYNFTIYASVRQYGLSRSFAMDVKINQYKTVRNISTNKAVSEIVFDQTKTEVSFVVNLTPLTSTNLNVKYFLDYTGSVQIIENPTITEIQKGSWLVTLKLNSNVLSSEELGEIRGTFTIVPADWVTLNNQIVDGKQGIVYNLYYQDGTEANPFILESATDLLSIGESEKAMGYHYRISSTIDMSSYADRLPLGLVPNVNQGVFTGSIIGSNNAKIIGLKIANGKTYSNGNYYGLFAKIGSEAHIENVTFEGSFNISSSRDASLTDYIGLIAGQNEGTLKNVAVVLNDSDIRVTASNSNIGGVVGVNNGIIQKAYSTADTTNTESIYNACSPMTTLITEGRFDVVSASRDTGVVNIGGIAGLNENQISDDGKRTVYGYSGYMAYANINILSEGLDGATIYAGAVAGQSSGSVYGMLVGGKISSSLKSAYIGGLVGNMTGGRIGTNSSAEEKSVTTRLFVRGFNVGAIVGSASAGMTSNITNVSVQATDDGQSLNDQASMVIKYVTEDSEASAYNNASSEANQYSFIAVGTVGGLDVSTSNITFTTYVSRDYLEGSNIVFINTTNSYFGDFIIQNFASSKVVAQKQFNKVSAGQEISLTPNSDYGFVELKAGDEDPQMITMYYFKADSYVDETGKYSTVDLQKKAQDLLDKQFNTVSEDSHLRPFKLNAGEFTIKSESKLLTIDSKNNMIVHGQGVAKLVVSSMLDARLNKVVYLNIINYFNNKAAIDGQSFFVCDGVRLTDNSDIRVYSQQNAIINISPIYKWEEFKINEEGEVQINNTVIKLAENKGINAGVDVTGSEFTDHASFDISSDMVVLSKKANVKTNKDTEDAINLSASLSATVDETNYTYKYANESLVNVKYYEGVTEVVSNYDTYVLNTSGTQTDEVILRTDDEEENLNYTISREGFLQNKDSLNPLFNVEWKKVEESFNGNLRFNVEISINKDSSEYKNRFENDIFGEYEIEFFGKSNQGIRKKIKLTLDDQYIDNVVIENYSSEEDLIPSDRIVPSQKGLLSITLSPADVDFKRFVLENDEINFKEGSTRAIFEVGTLKNNNGSLVFEAIGGAVYSTTGVSISKNSVVDALRGSYDGQFYVRYLFGNSATVVDGSQVAFNSYLIGNNDEVIFEQKVVYKVFKEFSFNVSISNKKETNEKYYVARGVSYKLEIENSGYDSDTIQIKSSNPSVATISRDLNGDYILEIIGRTIDYATEGSFQILSSASRINTKGEVQTQTDEKSCQIMQYVVTYDNSSAEDRQFDIVKGMENGNISVAVGGAEKLEIDLGEGKYLEYDKTSQTATEAVRNFLASLTANGTWAVYTNITTGNALPEFIQGNSENFERTGIKNGVSFENKYFAFDGLSFITNLEHNPNILKNYIFTYEGYYKLDEINGIYQVVENSAGAEDLYSEFSLISYIRGSEETPNPIKDYDGLKSMGTGAHYILTNDIYITPETFEPITSNFASLDGNGYSIIFQSGTYDISNRAEVGLFTEIGQDSIVKNLTIQVSDNASDEVIFEAVSSEAILVGLVSAKNSGQITNAKVYGLSKLSATFKTQEEQTLPSACVVAGITANNTGKITNSRVLLSISSNVSLAGLVGTNSGVIASSYYKNGILTNVSDENTKFYTAGLVVNNTEGGRIITSYSSGRVDSAHIYSYITSLSLLDSKVQVAGLIHSNSGTVLDCYSNIPITTSSSSAGFVYENAGTIKNCFSTSIILNHHTQSNYYFAARDNITSERGSFENCFYLKDSSIGVEYIDPKGVTVTGINESLASDKINGVSALDIKGFANTDNFSSYTFGKSPREYNNVWVFIPAEEDVINDHFKETIIERSSATGKFSSARYIDQDFAGGRLELVSANILASSVRSLDEEKTQTKDGVTTYFYNYEANEYGSVLNPYIIDSAELFEKYMTSDGNSNKNYNHFRFVSDISYLDYDSNMGTYDVDFFGILEGNGMTISNISISAGEDLESAGLLATLTGSLDQVAAIMNLTVIPNVVNFPNAKVVGGLIGKVSQATVANINIYSNVIGQEEDQGDSVTVSGKNIVGGVIGLVDRASTIKNITSTVGGKASFVPSKVERVDEQIYSEFADNSAYSYSGGIVGYAYATSGRPVVINGLKSYGINAYVIGQKTGFALGGMSRFVTLSDVTVNLTDEMAIKAYEFGGIVVGESAGTIEDVVVSGSGSQTPLFSVDGYIPDAVGGIIGFMIEGSLSKAYMGQSFIVKPVNGSQTINYVGGIVGRVGKALANVSSLSEVVMDGDISSRKTLGGVIGYSTTKVDMHDIAIYAHKLGVIGELSTIAVGGFIGKNDQSVTINDAYSLANIYLNAYTYNKGIKANVSAILSESNPYITNQLSNIYTTTQYDISLENKNVVSSTKDVTCRPVSEGSQGNTEYHLFSGDERLDSITFNPETQAEDLSKVYSFVGFIDGNNVVSVLQKTTFFKVRGDVSTPLQLNQVEQGYSIVKKYNDDNIGADYATVPSINMMYGIMSGEAKWVNPVDTSNKPNALPYLEFELSLRKN